MLGEDQHDAEREARDDQEQERHDRHDDGHVFSGEPVQPLEQPRPPGADRLIVEEPLEIESQLARRGVAAPRVFGHGLQDDRFQVERDVGSQRRGPARLVLGDLAEQVLAV